MPAIIEPPGPDEATAPLGRRLAWFFGIAIGAALSTAVVAYGLRALLK
jgi:hypothetical protein